MKLENELVNHHLNYVRETDYVSAACAMVRRPTPRAVVYPSTPLPFATLAQERFRYPAPGHEAPAGAMDLLWLDDLNDARRRQVAE